MLTPPACDVEATDVLSGDATASRDFNNSSGESGESVGVPPCDRTRQPTVPSVSWYITAAQDAGEACGCNNWQGSQVHTGEALESRAAVKNQERKKKRGWKQMSVMTQNHHRDGFNLHFKKIKEWNSVILMLRRKRYAFFLAITITLTAERDADRLRLHNPKIQLDVDSPLGDPCWTLWRENRLTSVYGWTKWQWG